LGVLPGVGSVAAVSILLPVTYHVPPVTGLIMLAGLYYGAVYGCLWRGYRCNSPEHSTYGVRDRMPRRISDGSEASAEVALFMTTMASLCGSSVGIVVLALFAPPLASVALTFNLRSISRVRARHDGRSRADARLANQVFHPSFLVC
jgi:putative tricarboxylic transport membrane protein